MVGQFYDEARGYSKFVPNKRQKEELLAFFDHQCCYCGRLITVDSLSQDHLIPMNKEHLGLHAWGNVVPAAKIATTQSNTVAGQNSSQPKRREKLSKIAKTKYWPLSKTDNTIRIFNSVTMRAICTQMSARLQ